MYTADGASTALSLHRIDGEFWEFHFVDFSKVLDYFNNLNRYQINSGDGDKSINQPTNIKI